MRTKIILISLLATCCILAVIGCGNNSGTPAEFNEAALQTRAEEIVSFMVNGDYAAVNDQFTPEVKAQLSLEQLQSNWLSITDPIGAYLGHYQTSGEVYQEEYYVVKVLSRFELNRLLTTVTFNTAGEIAGLWINYQAIDTGPVSTDAYSESEFTVGEYDLPGLLTLPKNVDTPPVVLLIQGSGATDKNETIGAASNTPFMDIAHGLAEQGIATLRYDKRYYAHSELAANGDTVTVESEILDDAYAAINQLAADQRIDNSRIFVLGHSLGGMLAPKIAADNDKVTGIIIMAGSLRNLAEIALDQSREYAAALMPTLTDEEKVQWQNQLAQGEADVAAILQLSEEDCGTYLGMPAAYWYSLNQAGGYNYLHQLSIPILILQGSEDFQVYPERDFVLWQDYYSDNPQATLILYDGLNHLFMESSGLRTIEDYDTPNRVRQDVIDDIADWIKNG